MVKSLAVPLFAALVGAVAGDVRFLQDDNATDVSESTCTEIMEIICDNDGEYQLDMLCEAIQMAGVQEEFDTDTWTVFAPTDAAFASLPSELIAKLVGGPTLDDHGGLIDMLAFHTVQGFELESTDLRCDGRTAMANEEFSVTICEGDRVYQIGLGNPVTAYPEITVANIEACNGFVHLINGVMLPEAFAPMDGPLSEPTEAPLNPTDSPTLAPSVELDRLKLPDPESIATEPSKKEVRSMAEIICDSEDFTHLCEAISVAGFSETLTDEYFTIFAPNDAAFEKLGEVAMAYLMENVDLLRDVLAFHKVKDEIIYSSDLKCTERLKMSNGKDSRSVCRKEAFYQKGKGNSVHHSPEVVEVDIKTCNGIMHVVNEVMLFDYPEELGLPPRDATFAPTLPIKPSAAPSVGPTKAPSPCKTVDQLVCEDPDFSILCSNLEITGVSDALSTGSWTLFAPNNMAFLKLPPDSIQILTADEEKMSKLLLFHAVSDQVLYHGDLPCVAGQNLIEMANGKDSRTLCKDITPRVPVPRYQKGKVNTDDALPAFLATDIEACNGVIHELDGVLLFEEIDEMSDSSD